MDAQDRKINKTMAGILRHYYRVTIPHWGVIYKRRPGAVPDEVTPEGRFVPGFVCGFGAGMLAVLAPTWMLI